MLESLFSRVDVWTGSIVLLLISFHVSDNSLMWILFSFPNSSLKSHFFGFRSTPRERSGFLRSVIIVGHLFLETDLFLLTFTIPKKWVHVIVSFDSA